MAKTTAKKPVKKVVAKLAEKVSSKTTSDCTCCYSRTHTQFSGVILIIAILWILQEFAILAWDIPWLPIIIALAALGRLSVQKK